MFENVETTSVDELGINWIALFHLGEEVSPLGGKRNILHKM